MSGRYGPYVKYDRVNATLPRDVSPETVTLEQAVALVAAKQSKGKPERKAPARAKAPAKAKAKVPAKAKAKAPAKAKPKPKAKAKAKVTSAQS
jgi:DNA topoisomerase-1